MNTRIKISRLIYGLISLILLSSSDVRLGIKRRLERAYEDGELPRIYNDTKLESSRLRFWLLLPLAWDKRNIKSEVAFFTFTIPLFYSIWLGVGFHYIPSIFANAPIFVSLFAGLLLIMTASTRTCFKDSLRRERDPDLCLLKLWLLTRFGASAISGVTNEELARESSRLAYPVSTERFRNAQKVDRILGLITWSLMLSFMAWGLSFVASQNRTSPPEVYQFTLLFGVIGSFIPIMIGHWIIDMETPIQISGQHASFWSVSRKSMGNALSAEDVRDHFHDREVMRGLTNRAKWFYYFGAISGWNYDSFPGTLLLLFILAVIGPLALLQPGSTNTLPNATSIILAYVVVGLPIAILYLLISLRQQTTKKRRNMCKAFKDGGTLEEIVDFNDVLGSFVSGRYSSAYENNGLIDMTTSWYVRELTKYLKRKD